MRKAEPKTTFLKVSKKKKNELSDPAQQTQISLRKKRNFFFCDANQPFQFQFISYKYKKPLSKLEANISKSRVKEKLIFSRSFDKYHSSKIFSTVQKILNFCLIKWPSANSLGKYLTQTKNHSGILELQVRSKTMQTIHQVVAVYANKKINEFSQLVSH